MGVWLLGALLWIDLRDLVVFVVKPQLGLVLSPVLGQPVFSVLSTSKWPVEVILNGLINQFQQLYSYRLWNLTLLVPVNVIVTFVHSRSY